MGKVYILGAGASRALNAQAPLMSDLLPTALSYADNGRSSRSPASARNVRAFINDLYGFTPYGEVLPPFEDLFSHLDYCLINDLPLSKDYTVERLRSLRQDLMYLLGRVIQRQLRDSTPAEQLILAQFIEQVAASSDVIISLNYDLLMDNAFDRPTTPGVDYGFRPRFRETISAQRQTQSLPVQLLKLHGSLNWLYCPICREIEVYNFQKAALITFYKDTPCRLCQTQLEALMITPSFLKNYNNLYLVEIWRKAEHELHEADEVVFVGYSLPEADVVLRLFLTRALYANWLRHEQERRCKVTVIDQKKPGIGKLKWAVRQRYEQVFGDIDYDDSGFAAYIERGCKTPLVLRS